MTGKKQVLGDHKRIGKRFIAPFQTALGSSLNEISWVVDLVPEVLWLALFNDAYGIAKGAALSLILPKVVLAQVPAKAGFFGITSSFATLSADDWTRIREQIAPKAALEDLYVALRPLVAVFPECPLSGLWANPPTAKSGDIDHLRQIVEHLLDRASSFSTFVQANAVYIAFITGRLSVAPHISLANFPEIENFPHTEESRRVASGVRAALNMFGRPPGAGPRTAWVAYFWTRGMEITPCTSLAQ